MAINEFLTFAGDPAANVMTQAQYSDAGFTARILGFSSGTAVSTELNKAWRQASVMAHMIGQFTVDYSGQDMRDDATSAGITAMENSFALAVHAVALGAVGTGYLPLSGGTLIGNLQINSDWLSIFGPTGRDAQVNLYRDAGSLARITAWTSQQILRWQLQLANNDPEQGADTGSNFSIISYHDGGQPIETPLGITRATGVVNFAHTPTVAGQPMAYVRLTGGDVMTGPLGIGGPGLSYNGLTIQQAAQFSGHRTAFGWDGATISVAVDGTYVGQLATSAGTGASLANYVLKAGDQMTGTLVIRNAGLTVDGAAGFGSTVYFAGLSDFVNFRSGTARYRQWFPNWYDMWDGGTRGWSVVISNNPVWGMTLDPIGNLYVRGVATIDGGRVISQAAGFASIAVWNKTAAGPPGTGPGVCTGFYSDAQGMWLGNLDQNGNTAGGQAHVLISNNGAVSIFGPLTVNGNVVGTGSTSGQGYYFTWTDTSGRAAQGAIYGRGIDVGAWRIIGPDDPTQSQQLGVTYRGGPLTYHTPSYADPAGPGAMYVDVGGNAIFQGNVNARAFGPLSDENMKQNIEAWNAGLDAVLAIRPVSFEYTDIPDCRRYFGVTAQALMRALPDAVVTQRVCQTPDLSEDFLTVDLMTLTCATINAIRELEARLRDAETMIRRLTEGASHV